MFRFQLSATHYYRELIEKAGHGSSITYDMEFVAKDEDAIKVCEAKLLVNVYLQIYKLLYYACQDPEIDERDDIPDDEIEEEDESDFVDCDKSDIQVGTILSRSMLKESVE